MAISHMVGTVRYGMVMIYSSRLNVNQYGLPIPARCQLNRENEISLSPFTPGNLVSRDRFGRAVPR